MKLVPVAVVILLLPLANPRAAGAQEDDPAADRQRRVAAMVARIFEHDANGDGQISRDEVPDWMKSGFDNWDLDADGVATRDEIERAAAAFVRSRDGAGAERWAGPAEGAPVVDVTKGEGIHWRGDPRAVLERARRENRPVFVAVNALDEETGNRAMAFTRLRHPDLVAASRHFLCLVASPNEHGDGETCRRFGFCSCADHQEVMTWTTRRFADEDGSLTSPQHLILAPDGTVVFRRPYWIPVAALRRELEKALAATAPRRALTLAAGAREETIEALKSGSTDAVAYAKSDDPLAGGVLLYLWETEEEAEKRERWEDALRALPVEAFPMVRVDLIEDPRLIDVAKAIDPKRGAWWERYHRSEAPPPAPDLGSPELAAALAKLRGGDDAQLDQLLEALWHPVDGPEVRAALAHWVGRDLGPNPAAWREELTK